MKNIYLLMVISGFIPHFKTEYVNIWNHTSNMNANNGWTGYNNFTFEMNSDKCVISPCCCVTADNNGPSYIEKTTNITSYHSIQLQMNINAYDIQKPHSCTMWYNFDNAGNTMYAGWRRGKYGNITINFPKSIIAKTIYIRLQVIRNHGSCYWDNVILRGIPVTNVSNINTNVTASRARVLFTRAGAILSITPCICWILIVITGFIRKRINKEYNTETSLTSTEGMVNLQNIQKAMMEFMSSLHLSEDDSKYSNHTNINELYSNTTTNSTTVKYTIPLKTGDCEGKGDYETIVKPYITTDSVEMACERQYYHNYSEMSTTVNSVSQILASIRGELLHVENSLLIKLERMANELDFETMKQIVDKNKHEICYTDPSIYSVTETNNDMETITETYSDCASMQVHLNYHSNHKFHDQSPGRMETFL